MKRHVLWVSVVFLLVASSTYAAPVGPGGRIYYTRTAYHSGSDNSAELLRLDVDTNWDVVADCGTIATVLNQYALNTGGTIGPGIVTSPEILHPRASHDGSATGGDGSVFLAHYYDCGTHTRYTKVLPDGTTSVLHPGIGDDSAAPSTGGQSAIPYVIDRDGQATGRAASPMTVGGRVFAWYDTNANDDLTDAGDVCVRDGSHGSIGYGGDAEVGGNPNDSSTRGTVYCNSYRSIYAVSYTGDADCHTWTSGTFFDFYDWATATGGEHDDWYFRMNSSALATGDTDGDGNEDVYTICTDTRGLAITTPSIVRFADLDDSGRIDAYGVDIAKIIYDSDTLGGTDNNLGNGDVELIKDPTTGKWTLLILERGSSWSGTDGRILAVELADNGDFAGTTDAFKIVLTGIETGGNMSHPETRDDLWGIEFDAEPGGVIPEPASVLLIGTGVLGLVGYLRRRRMS